MATKLKTTKRSMPLVDFALPAPAGGAALNPYVVGSFAADPVTANNSKQYGVFTVPDEAPNPSQWAGVYRIDISWLKASTPDVFASVD